jgi:hypothetical protein
MADVLEIDVLEGIRVERTFTEEEIAQKAIDLENRKILQTEKQNAEIEIANKRKALLEKLGITQEEANLLLS